MKYEHDYLIEKAVLSNYERIVRKQEYVMKGGTIDFTQGILYLELTQAYESKKKSIENNNESIDWEKWIFGTTRKISNRLFNQLRKKSREIDYIGDRDFESPEKQKDYTELFYSTLNQVLPKERSFIEYYLTLDHGQKAVIQAGRRFGLGRSSAYKWFDQIKSKLHDILQGELE